MSQNSFDLDSVVMEVPGKEGKTNFTVRQMLTGNFIVGGTGAGKSSSVGAFLAKKMLSMGMGGLVLCVKEDECAVWEQYCRETNRTKDLVIIRSEGSNHYDFITDEISRNAKAGAITDNIVHILTTVLKAGEDKDSGRSNDTFWSDSLSLLMTSVIDLCVLAYGTLSVEKMYDIVLTTPQQQTAGKKEAKDDGGKEKTPFEKAFNLAQENINNQIEQWHNSQSFKDAGYANITDEETYNTLLFKALPDVRKFKYVDNFFVETFRVLSDKTKSIIIMSFASFLSRLLRDPVHTLFCSGKKNARPDLTLEGKIIILDIPVKRYHKFARDAQTMYKYLWQRCVESRPNHQSQLPVFLWSDEATYFLHEYDPEFQATCRSSRVIVVYLTQNIHALYASMGGVRSESRVKQFLGTLSNKFFLANADIETNNYASALCGDAWTEDTSSTQSGGEHYGWSNAKSYRLQRLVRPEEFGKLKTGGPDNNYIVEAFLHMQGKCFANGFNFKGIQFNQRFIINQ